MNLTKYNILKLLLRTKKELNKNKNIDEYTSNKKVEFRFYKIDSLFKNRDYFLSPFSETIFNITWQKILLESIYNINLEKLFEHFLSDSKILEQFNHNLLTFASHNKKTIHDLVRCRYTRPTDYIIGAFNWNSSKEKDMLWYSLHGTWQGIITNMLNDAFYKTFNL